MGNLLISKKATKEKAIEYLTRFNLLDKRNSYPLELSGGQRQRIAIIQQLLMDNHFLLMDEPFSGLDVVSKEAVGGLILEITKIHEENTIVFTTHDVEMAVSLAEYVWVMAQEKDAEGNQIGAKIIKNYDLIEAGLAWNPEMESDPKYQHTVNEIKALFRTL
jgi:ABC-type nitrate/sulfonate/bicarbonate transport system ATPase subunit